MTLHSHDRSRPGISLLEVLTAIFIMGVGLLALLTLFPLGALSMARAVRDDRAATAGANAAALANAMDLRNDPNITAQFAVVPPGYAAPDPNGQSYPVLVDPVFAVVTPLFGVGTGTPGIARVAPTYAQTATARARWFTLQDEIVFEKTGQPTGGGVTVNRPGTYSWAYLLRRPRSASPAMTDLSVIVFGNRATDAQSVEQSISGVTGAAGATSLAFAFAGDRPNIRKGGWIVDTTYRRYPDPVMGPYGTVNGYFYRVASVTDTGANSMTLELETPLKESVTTLVVMDNVITVLDRGTGWLP